MAAIDRIVRATLDRLVAAPRRAFRPLPVHADTLIGCIDRMLRPRHGASTRTPAQALRERIAASQKNCDRQHALLRIDC